MNTFYFDTGVKPQNITNPPFQGCYNKGQVLRNGTIQIPFDCDAPADARVKFLCSDPNLPEGKSDWVIVREVFNTAMMSKYAYMGVTAKQKAESQV